MKDVRKLVRKAYATVAKKQSSCCEKSCCGNKSNYAVDGHPVPEAELGLSCGNPISFGYIKKGDVVLDLGSGAGKDVFLAAQKTGKAGKAIGVDMTPEMLSLAKKNAKKFAKITGLSNVEFRKGMIEELPVDDDSVDIVISNCVINLSPDKPQVFREIYRVLRPSGKMIVSDIVLNKPLPDELKNDKELYSACISGALLKKDYLKAIKDAGFKKVKVLSEHIYKSKNACDDPITSECGGSLEGVASSATVFALK